MFNLGQLTAQVSSDYAAILVALKRDLEMKSE